jgi:hypothetical protein
MSPLPETDSILPLSTVCPPGEKKREDKRINTPPSPSACPPSKPRRKKGNGSHPEGFDLFWQKYPLKKGIDNAIRAFANLNPDPEQLRGIMTDLFKRSRQDDEWTRGIIPRASTYLNQKLWRDAIKPMTANRLPKKDFAKWTPTTTEKN